MRNGRRWGWLIASCLVLVGAVSAVGPSSALAYVGDDQANVVVNPETNELTTEAQTYLRGYDSQAHGNWVGSNWTGPGANPAPADAAARPWEVPRRAGEFEWITYTTEEGLGSDF